MSEIAPYPVSGVSNQHTTVSPATPITAAMYCLNGAKDGGDETSSSLCAFVVIADREEFSSITRQSDGLILINLTHPNVCETMPSNFSTVLTIRGLWPI
jgi:hypothetical protein